jgi:hypothetical protein
LGTVLELLSILGKLLPLLLQGVATVQQATGGTASEAAQVVANHLTPGQPNAPALGPIATPPAA